MVATPRERLDALPSAPALEPSEGKQDERYDERNDGALDVEVRDAAARIDTRWNEPVHGGRQGIGRQEFRRLAAGVGS